MNTMSKNAIELVCMILAVHYFGMELIMKSMVAYGVFMLFIRVCDMFRD